MKDNLLYRIVEERRINDIYPTKSYYSDLDLFRSLSTENKETALYLKKKLKGEKNIVDLGCGDGTLVYRIIKESNLEPINHLHLIDINETVLKEADEFLNSKNIAKKVTAQCDDILNNLPICYNDKDVGFLIHVAYFIPFSQFTRIIDSIPKKFRLFIVLDKEDCVFSKLWKKTAPEYLDRAIKVNDYLRSLSHTEFSVRSDIITSWIDNPFSMDDKLMKKLVSFISYKSVDEMTASEFKFVKKTIASFFVKDNGIKVETNVFEISRS